MPDSKTVTLALLARSVERRRNTTGKPDNLIAFFQPNRIATHGGRQQSRAKAFVWLDRVDSAFPIHRRRKSEALGIWRPEQRPFRSIGYRDPANSQMDLFQIQCQPLSTILLFKLRLGVLGLSGGIFVPVLLFGNRRFTLRWRRFALSSHFFECRLELTISAGHFLHFIRQVDKINIDFGTNSPPRKRQDTTIG